MFYRLIANMSCSLRLRNWKQNLSNQKRSEINRRGFFTNIIISMDAGQYQRLWFRKSECLLHQVREFQMPNRRVSSSNRRGFFTNIFFMVRIHVFLVKIDEGSRTSLIGLEGGCYFQEREKVRMRIKIQAMKTSHQCCKVKAKMKKLTSTKITRHECMRTEKTNTRHHL